MTLIHRLRRLFKRERKLLPQSNNVNEDNESDHRLTAHVSAEVLGEANEGDADHHLTVHVGAKASRELGREGNPDYRLVVHINPQAFGRLRWHGAAGDDSIL
jgi:hypothetical protein